MARNKKRRMIRIPADPLGPDTRYISITEAELPKVQKALGFKGKPVRGGLLSFYMEGDDEGGPVHDVGLGGGSYSGTTSPGRQTESGGVGAQSQSAASPGRASTGRQTESGGVGAQSGRSTSSSGGSRASGAAGTSGGPGGQGGPAGGGGEGDRGGQSGGRPGGAQGGGSMASRGGVTADRGGGPATSSGGRQATPSGTPGGGGPGPASGALGQMARSMAPGTRTPAGGAPPASGMLGRLAGPPRAPGSAMGLLNATRAPKSINDRIGSERPVDRDPLSDDTGRVVGSFDPTRPVGLPTKQFGTPGGWSDPTMQDPYSNLPAKGNFLGGSIPTNTTLPGFNNQNLGAFPALGNDEFRGIANVEPEAYFDLDPELMNSLRPPALGGIGVPTLHELENIEDRRDWNQAPVADDMDLMNYSTPQTPIGLPQAYDPLSSIQAPRRAPQPALPEWTEPTYQNPPKSFPNAQSPEFQNKVFTNKVYQSEGTLKPVGTYDSYFGDYLPGAPKPTTPISQNTINANIEFAKSKISPWSKGLKGVSDLVKAKGTSAIGAGQFQPATLKQAAENLGMDPETQIMDPVTQDRLTTEVARMQGLKAWEGLSKRPDLRADAQQAINAGALEQERNLGLTSKGRPIDDRSWTGGGILANTGPTDDDIRDVIAGRGPAATPQAFGGSTPDRPFSGNLPSDARVAPASGPSHFGMATDEYGNQLLGRTRNELPGTNYPGLLGDAAPGLKEMADRISPSITGILSPPTRSRLPAAQQPAPEEETNAFMPEVLTRPPVGLPQPPIPRNKPPAPSTEQPYTAVDTTSKKPSVDVTESILGTTNPYSDETVAQPIPEPMPEQEIPYPDERFEKPDPNTPTEIASIPVAVSVKNSVLKTHGPDLAKDILETVAAVKNAMRDIGTANMGGGKRGRGIGQLAMAPRRRRSPTSVIPRGAPLLEA